MLKQPLLSPVELISTDPREDQPEEGIALCLSGGGYRAMLFHLGALWRLNETGYLPRLKRVSSVSGGSITAGVLGLAWPKLDFDERGVARRFGEQIVGPLRRLASQTIDVPAVLSNLVAPGSASRRIADAYRRFVFGDCTLQALPADAQEPRFVINAANLQSGALWRFSRPYMWDYRVGKIENPTVPLAIAVAASSAAPPMLSPVVLKFQPSDYLPASGLDLQFPPFNTVVYLTDGGVYDNLGLETAWKRYRTVLVSDGGGQAGATPNPHRDWLRGTARVIGVIDNQVRDLRKRQAISSYQAGARAGAYWGIRSHITDYGLPETLPCPADRTLALANAPTRLSAMPDGRQEELINWGYAICDAALRRHVDLALACPADFPYPGVGVG
jgi:NTE family protein